MSRVSTQQPPPGVQEQEPVSLAPLPLEADPSAFTERAPELLSLLPDEALSLALSRADAFAVHAALTARLAREPAGPTRDTLQALLAHRVLFVMAERPPVLSSFLGCGVRFVGLPAIEAQETPFIVTRAVCLLGFPVWPLGEHLVRRGRDGQLETLGRVAGMSSSRTARWVRPLALGGVALALAGFALAPFVVREVELVNGLSRPVEVHLNDRTLTLKPGEVVREQLYGLGRPYHVDARWPGTEQPFETLSLESSQRAVYNVLGAASLRVDDAAKWNDTSRFPGSTGRLESDEQLHVQGGWKSKLHGYVMADQWRDAAALAKAVFLADPSELEAGEEAARLLARNAPAEALQFARELREKSSDELAGNHRIAQDLFIALGKREEAFTLYAAAAKAAPMSLRRAMLAVRVAPPEHQREALERVRALFPMCGEVKRATARLRLAEGFPQDALKLLDEALQDGPESVEDLELRVRTLLSLKQVREASLQVRQFADKYGHASWEFSILAGRLARVAGPKRTQYVVRDLITSSVTTPPERMALLGLLTGSGTVSSDALKAIKDPFQHHALDLTRTLLKDVDTAVALVSSSPEKLLGQLDPETAAVLGLELVRRGERKAADRLFSTSLALMAAREPLEAYVSQGEVKPAFPLLPPELQAAAYLVRARAVRENRFVEQAYARWTDVLGGVARMALDPDSEQAPEEPPPPSTPRRRTFTPFLLVRSNVPAAAPAPEPEAGRVPRPWPAP